MSVWTLIVASRPPCSYHNEYFSFQTPFNSRWKVLAQAFKTRPGSAWAVKIISEEIFGNPNCYRAATAADRFSIFRSSWFYTNKQLTKVIICSSAIVTVVFRCVSLVPRSGSCSVMVVPSCSFLMLPCLLIIYFCLLASCFWKLFSITHNHFFGKIRKRKGKGKT